MKLERTLRLTAAPLLRPILPSTPPGWKAPVNGLGAPSRARISTIQGGFEKLSLLELNTVLKLPEKL